MYLDGVETECGGGGYRKTTNNRMEIKAAAMALAKAADLIRAAEHKIEGTYDITVHSDNQLVVGTVNLGWARNTNNDLWQELDWAIDSIKDLKATLTLVKVKGHANDAGNNAADKLAVSMSKDSPQNVDEGYENPLPQESLFTTVNATKDGEHINGLRLEMLMEEFNRTCPQGDSMELALFMFEKGWQTADMEWRYTI